MSADVPPNITKTRLLGGRVTCYQPKRGYRTAVDAVLLAACVPAEVDQRILDIGTGAGASAFCLAARVEGAKVTGLELQRPLATLAERGVEANGYQSRIEIIAGDLLEPPECLAPASFDHVMANPPYVKAGKGNPPPDPVKALAMVEGRAKLFDWLKFAAAMVKPKGSITIIHRAERGDEVVSGLAANGCGAIEMLPVAPKSDGVAKRTVVRAWKDKKGETLTHTALVLHVDLDAGNGHRRTYTEVAESVLRGAESLL